MNENKPELRHVDSMGMLVDEWTHKSCTAIIGVGEDWATIYMINSSDESKGHATELLTYLKEYYKKNGQVFGSSIALNERMRNLLKRLNIIEYSESVTESHE